MDSRALDNLCKSIIDKENYYDILGLRRSCTMDQVKKAYRKTVLRIHPDKNKSKFARQAFQKLSKAFICLSSDTLRQIYDKTGNEELPDSALHHNFDEDFAEKLFNEMFKDSESKNKEPLYKSYLAKCFILQLIPILIIVIVGMYTSSIYNAKLYSFTISPHYNIKKATQDNHISYFMNSEISRDMSDLEIQTLEAEVETQYFYHQQKKKDYENARLKQNTNLYEESD